MYDGGAIFWLFIWRALLKYQSHRSSGESIPRYRIKEIVDSHKIENGLTLILSERVAYSLSAALSAADAISRCAILSAVQLICRTCKSHVRSAVACDCCNLIGSIRFWIEHTGSVQEHLDPLLPPRSCKRSLGGGEVGDS